MVDVPLSRKSVSRVLLVVGLLLFGPQVQTGDQPASPSFWENYAQPAMGYWKNAAHNYTTNMSELLGHYNEGSLEYPAPVQPVATPLPASQAYSDSRFGTWYGELPETRSTPTAAPQQAVPPITPALASSSNFPAQSTPSFAQRAAYSAYSWLPIKVQAGLASLSVLGTVYAAKKLLATYNFNRISNRYFSIMQLFLSDTGEVVYDNPTNVNRLDNLIVVDNARVQGGLITLPSIYKRYPLVGFIENLNNSINSLSVSSLLYGTEVYRESYEIKNVLDHVKYFIVHTEKYSNENAAYERELHTKSIEDLQREVAQYKEQLRKQRK